ncbi:I78 family peptidase inhibitor [Pseudomonas psychrophila]|uniref:Peptidase inhibitor I78 family protein n=1 Tax=Pseudomonas psychrophila TaxID=122355 RepID=A0ABY0VH54_9PSED|nr:I78 family peptidase inhibitor [Pseudomonas psychrophila]KAB0484414.1 hypothetical protein F7Q95_23660 [Pseudomonas psychrophila]KMM96228.1 hypothetical protein TU76_23230 [Pseudomonas psychrophila]QIE31397.1 hypothetical protein G5J76_03690 [Pseudomonas psychrophila]WVI97942.1 I78 family peptidase inhibitor [Pseudomonas psychrophila]SDU24344.1 Peptidase inhibitor I78 family protein [Pseudomonas psychrophila]
MSKMTVSKIAALAASMMLAALSLPAMAAEEGLCDKNLTLNYVVAPEVTPQLVEFWRNIYGAREVRVEVPGEGYTKEFNRYRLRVLVNEGKKLSSLSCG